MRILHTSDWHLGATLKDHPRDFEHERFLDWLTALLRRDEYDAILITGDIFDTANPPHRALTLWYRWLTAVVSLLPALQIIVIGGNHDSAARLDAPAELLRALRIHTVGGLARMDDGKADIGCTPIPLKDRDGCVRAVVGAVPFLGAAAGEDIADVYQRVVERLREVAPAEAALLLTGHLYAAGPRPSWRSRDSERDMVGGVENVSVAAFPDDVAYVALGHLHRPQEPGERAWYAGSPLPLSFAEQEYLHRVVRIDVEPVANGRATARLLGLPIPRSVVMETWPAPGQRMAFADARFRLAALPAAASHAESQVPTQAPDLPLVQICLAAGATAVEKRELDELAKGKRIRLLYVDIDTTVRRADGSAPRARLEQVSPLIVFQNAWEDNFPDEPMPAEVRAAYDEAVAAYNLDQQ